MIEQLKHVLTQALKNITPTLDGEPTLVLDQESGEFIFKFKVFKTKDIKNKK